FLSKAKKRLEEIQVKEAKEKALANINGLILDRRFNEAQKELDRFAQNYPSEPSTVKDLRKKLFSLDSDFGGTANPNSPRKPIGFGTPNPSPISDDGDDFFGTPPKTKQPRKVATKKESQNNQTKKDDFFDSTTSNFDDSGVSKQKYTNNDFNF
ncbi:hypothetical protein, partial [Turicimonas muris]|uniref:hypothetical protein n=1 Tax=Turicimonas muris TaxID=1796652 RepID=UPI002675A60E